MNLLEWLTDDDALIANATTDIQNDFIILQTSLQHPQPFVEIDNFALDSTYIYALKNVCFYFNFFESLHR